MRHDVEPTPSIPAPRPLRRAAAWRRGSGLLMVMLAAVVLICCAAFAVDVGRMHVARLELQGAADAAARQGAASLANGPVAAFNAAATIARENYCAGQRVELDWRRGDAAAGHYDNKKREFKPLDPSDKKVNAVRIITRRTGGDAVRTYFAGFLGRGAIDLQAEAIAVRVPPVSSKKWIPATSNPWLAGMPTGTTANPVNPHSRNKDFAPDTVGRDPDKAPAPISVDDVPIEAGQALAFDSIDGKADHKKSDTWYGPDGDTSKMANNRWAYGRDNGGRGGHEFGKSDIRVPYNAVVGVFLTDDVPSDADVPPDLDFWTDPKSREFTSLSPKVAQVFYIGDGVNKDGVTQRFVVPPGATRLFIGISDGYEWANNQGGHTTTIYRPMQVYLVE